MSACYSREIFDKVSIRTCKVHSSHLAVNEVYIACKMDIVIIGETDGVLIIRIMPREIAPELGSFTKLTSFKSDAIGFFRWIARYSEF